MFKKIFLLLVLTTSLSADENSWRFENYNDSTFIMITILSGIIAGQSKMISDFRKKCSQNEDDQGDLKLSSQEVEATLKQLDTMITVATIFLVTLLVRPTLYIVQDIYYWWSPTPEQILNNLEAQDKLKFLRSRAAFRKCLFDSDPNSQRGILNSPIGCEQLLNAFIACGGKDEAIEKINDFDTYYKG